MPLAPWPLMSGVQVVPDGATGVSLGPLKNGLPE
jgi:hypothetical protein